MKLYPKMSEIGSGMKPKIDRNRSRTNTGNEMTGSEKKPEVERKRGMKGNRKWNENWKEN
jgi:hypothetical protein